MRILLLYLVFGVFPAAYAAGETLTVEQAVAEALEHNLSLLAERANIDIARARVLAAGLRPNPVFSEEAITSTCSAPASTASTPAGRRKWACTPNSLMKAPGSAACASKSRRVRARAVRYLLELLDAQRAFNETMQAYNESRAEYARSLYVLDSISGKVPVP